MSIALPNGNKIDIFHGLVAMNAEEYQTAYGVDSDA